MLNETNAMGTIIAANPNGRNPMLNTWGMGPIKSIFSGGTKASTELVPRMKSNAIMGAATITERPIVRAGLRH